jgi:simple sugar transport system permease protein
VSEGSPSADREPPAAVAASASAGARLLGSPRARDGALFGVLVAAAIVGALAIASLVLAATGSTPSTAFSAMVNGSVTSWPSLATTLNHTALILTVAIGACVAGRAALVNIGQEGQLLIGATAGVSVGLWMPGPRWVVVPIVLLAAAAGGGLWSALAAVLRQVARVSEVITTLLLNFVAFALVSFLVNRRWLLQETLPEGSVSAPSPQSDPLPPGARLPVVVTGSGFRLHSGIVVAVVLAVAAGFVIGRTLTGFRLRMYGHNPRAATRAGVRGVVYGSGALVVSGAFAGFAGGVLLTGVAFTVNPGLSNNYGWEGLLVALVAGYSPVAAIPVAVLFGALRAGGGVLAARGVNSSIVGVVQALVVLAVMLPSLYLRKRKRRRQLESVLGAAPTAPAAPREALAVGS